MKLTKEIKENWLTALESGEYKKCQTQLKMDGGYCCLGVLAEIHPDISIDNNGKRAIVAGVDVGYNPFAEMLTGEVVNKLWSKNDDTETFKEVIEIIKEIPSEG